MIQEDLVFISNDLAQSASNVSCYRLYGSSVKPHLTVHIRFTVYVFMYYLESSIHLIR